MAPAERAAALGGHWLLYAFLFALPLTGWAMVSVSVYSIPTVLYWVLPWPDLPLLPTLVNKPLIEDALKRIHAAAALRHQFITRDDVLRRMWFSRRHNS